MVEYRDGSVVAQLSPPDMKLPIQYALTWPNRCEGVAPKLDWSESIALEFHPPDFERFPALSLGLEVAPPWRICRSGAQRRHEAAVAAFWTAESVSIKLSPACRDILHNHHFLSDPSLDQLQTLDLWAREEDNTLDSILLASTQDPNLLTTILTVAKAVVLVLVGVNMLIIVHEWGHFIVARMCGVRCDKFYIWFDIFGWKLFKFKWGDTEFGLGVLPLGGYVKMLGQEDNPGRLREELERAKAAETDKLATGAEENGDGSPAVVDIKAAEAALYDPQSYLSKSVPQRMAIISAGVFMNVVFAFVVAVIAYGMGVFKVDSEIGHVAPGGAAWKADLRAGDQVIEVAGERITAFDKLREATMLGDIDDGVEIVVKRPGVPEPVRTVVEPDRDQRLPTIGISNPSTTTLYEEEPTWFGTPAADCSIPVQGGDTIVAVNGKPVDSGFEYQRQEVIHRNEPMSLTIRRGRAVSESAARRGNHR